MSRRSRKKYWYFILLLIITPLAYLYFSSIQKKHSSIQSFKECVDAGYPILETYPEQCKIPGKSFINPDQKKETSLPEKESGLPFLNLTYLMNGSPIVITSSVTGGATTSSLEYDNNFYRDFLSQDTLEDTLFIAKRISEGKSSYYIFLALGLYNKGVAPANGILLGDGKPLTISKDKDGVILVTVACTSKITCTKKFLVKNDILEAQR